MGVCLRSLNRNEMAFGQSSRGHRRKGSERENEIFHLLSNYFFLAFRRPANIRISVQATLDEQLPVVGVDQLGALRADIPCDRFVPDEVLLQVFGVSTEVTTGRCTFHLPPFSSTAPLGCGYSPRIKPNSAVICDDEYPHV